MQEDMQEIHRPLKKKNKKMYKIHSGGAKRPHPAEGGVVDFVHVFADFPCALCGFPADLLLYICAYVRVYRGVISI